MRRGRTARPEALADPRRELGEPTVRLQRVARVRRGALDPTSHLGGAHAPEHVSVGRRRRVVRRELARHLDAFPFARLRRGATAATREAAAREQRPEEPHRPNPRTAPHRHRALAPSRREAPRASVRRVRSPTALTPGATVTDATDRAQAVARDAHPRARLTPPKDPRPPTEPPAASEASRSAPAPPAPARPTRGSCAGRARATPRSPRPSRRRA